MELTENSAVAAVFTITLFFIRKLNYSFFFFFFFFFFTLLLLLLPLIFNFSRWIYDIFSSAWSYGVANYYYYYYYYYYILFLSLPLLPMYSDNNVCLSLTYNFNVTQYYPLNVLTIRNNLLIIIMYHRFQWNFAFEECNCNAFFYYFCTVFVFVLIFCFCCCRRLLVFVSLCPATKLIWRKEIKNWFYIFEAQVHVCSTSETRLMYWSTFTPSSLYSRVKR